MNRTIRMFVAAACVVALQPLLASAGVIFSDDFSDLGGTSTGPTAIPNSSWVSGGSENKSDNDGAFAGKAGWDHSAGTSFDQLAVSFPSHTLTNVGDYITLSMDYLTRGTLDKAVGARIRLYDDDADLFSNANGGYGLTLASGGVGGGAAGQIRYYDFDGQAPFGTGLNPQAALAQNSIPTGLGDGGSITLTATKTGATEITLSSSFSGAAGTPVLASAVAVNNNFTFDALGIGVGNQDMGAEIDNVVVTTGSVPEPSTLALLSFGLVACAAGRRSRK